MYNDAYEFDWDEEKNQSNIEKHGLPFEEAKQAFLEEREVEVR